MCANADADATPTAPAIIPSSSPSPSPSPFVSTGRSILSRLASPLKSRARNLTDFHIRPDEPYRKYSPGDLVKGAVILTVVKPVRITHLTVCLHGFVRVYKHLNEVRDPWVVDPSLAAPGDPTKTQYFGNGHASLFQDEVTLCGEGRLEPGIYEFNFELEFPKKGLPTSIDFERGTISYLITATITRPTSIAATSSCDKKIALVETVDIGPMLPPKPRTISLEPISRRPKRKKKVKNKEPGSRETTDLGPTGGDAARPTGSPMPDDSASRRRSSNDAGGPRSPVPSDIQSTHSTATSTAASTDSTVSSSTGLSFRLGRVPSTHSARDSQGTGTKGSLSENTITATIQLLKSGCLAGDVVPLKISIKHTKAIKSLHGIIITLYRQGRIDSAPPLSLFADIKGKAAERLKHEEYYPKSKTGLGGLSLSSAGSSSLFRKDLAQTFAPILVDPVSLTAVINTSVRVPEDVFPTISGVPGQIICFKYYIEVVVDLGGKLASQQRHMPRAGTATNYGSTGARLDGNMNMLTTYGVGIVDTDHIRREKSVVACQFEVVVGSTDSARQRGRPSSSHGQFNNQPLESPGSPGIQDPIFEESFAQGTVEPQDLDEQAYHQHHDLAYDEGYPDYYSGQGYGYNEVSHHSNEFSPPVHSQLLPVPPPEAEPEEGLSEKARLRQAEARLLPSQPPPPLASENGDPSSSRTVAAPSAPSLPPLETSDDLYGDEVATPQAATTSLPFHPPDPSSDPDPVAASVPSLDDLHPTPATEATEDKQELQRRRLLDEASAPLEFPPNDDNDAGEGSAPPRFEPSAPVLTEEDEYGGHYAGDFLPSSPPPSHNETLPRYQR